MGCGGTRDKPKSDNELMEQIETQTKFTDYTFEELRTKILHYKTTEQNIISEHRFIDLLNKMKVEENNHALVIELFNSFAKKESLAYDIDKLLLAALLFSKPTDITNDQKIKFLYAIIEKEGPTELLTQSLKERLTDLIMIAGYWVPTIAKKNVDTPSTLEDLANYTKENVDDIVNGIIGNKYMNKRKIDTWGYKKILKQENSINVFSSKEIRAHISQTLNSLN